MTHNCSLSSIRLYLQVLLVVMLLTSTIEVSARPLERARQDRQRTLRSEALSDTIQNSLIHLMIRKARSMWKGNEDKKNQEKVFDFHTADGDRVDEAIIKAHPWMLLIKSSTYERETYLAQLYHDVFTLSKSVQNEKLEELIESPVLKQLMTMWKEEKYDPETAFHLVTMIDMHFKGTDSLFHRPVFYTWVSFVKEMKQEEAIESIAKTLTSNYDMTWLGLDLEKGRQVGVGNTLANDLIHFFRRTEIGNKSNKELFETVLKTKPENPFQSNLFNSWLFFQFGRKDAESMTTDSETVKKDTADLKAFLKDKYKLGSTESILRAIDKQNDEGFFLYTRVEQILDEDVDVAADDMKTLLKIKTNDDVKDTTNRHIDPELRAD